MNYAQFQNYGNEVQGKKSHPHHEIAQYFEVVGRISAQFFHRLPHNIEPDDVVQTATLALLELQQRYKEEDKPLNEGIVVLRVRGAIIDSMRSNDWMPRKTIAYKAKLVTAFRNLTQSLLREPTSQEMADHLEISLDEYHFQQMELSQTSLYSLEEIIDEHGSTIGDSRQTLPENAIEQEQLMALIKEAIVELSEKEQIFVTLFYQEFMSQKEIALILECSEASVSRIHGKVLIRLAAKLKNSEDGY